MLSKKIFLVPIIFMGVFFSGLGWAEQRLTIQNMTLDIPTGWNIHQTALNDGTQILGFEKDGEFITIYVKKQLKIDMKKIFVNGSTIEKDIYSEQVGDFIWKFLETSKVFSGGSPTPNDDDDSVTPTPSDDDDSIDDENNDNIKNEQIKYFVASFLTEYRDYSYYGYSRSSSTGAKALKNVTTFQKALKKAK